MKEEYFKSLFLKAQSGDEKAYAQFLSEIAVFLRAYLKKMLKDQYIGTDVEDLVQEIMMSVHLKRDLYDSKRAFLPWILAIAKYRMIDAYRSKVRKPFMEEYVDHASMDESLEEKVSRNLGEDQGAEILSGLNPKQREMIWLAKVEEIPLAQIAQKIEISEVSVKVGIHRVMKKLKKKFKDMV